jgi:hypothetical protein
VVKDADEHALDSRVKRIIDEVLELSDEALRIRNENRETIDNLRRGNEENRATAARLLFERDDAHAARVPASLIEWIRSEVRRLPNARDEHSVVDNVRLGELRAFLEAIDE